jgi:hypothetical protein
MSIKMWRLNVFLKFGIIFICMKPLYILNEFENCKSRGKLPFECELCHNTFMAIKKIFNGHVNEKTAIV